MIGLITCFPVRFSNCPLTVGQAKARPTERKYVGRIHDEEGGISGKISRAFLEAAREKCEIKDVQLTY